jgi:heat shock protein HslJ
VTRATVSDGFLHLTAAHTRLDYQKAPPPKLIAIIGTTWRLDSFPGHNGVLAQIRDEPAELRFENGTLFRVDTPCATFESNYTIDGKRVSVNGSEGGDFLCLPDINAMSDDLSAMLSGSFDLAIGGNALTVKSLNNGMTATFHGLAP